MAGCELLDTNETKKRLKQLLSSPGPARLAVAYWGRGAVTQLGLNKRTGKTQVLCDLFSGGCNPDEIKKLMIPGIEVRYCNELHAKFYLTSGGIVLGSSNASANGLGYEGEAVSGNVELNVLIRDRPFRKKAEQWFNQLWDENDGNLVDEDVAESARSAWKPRRAVTLLEALARNPEEFRGKPVKIVVYNEDEWDEDDEDTRWLKGEGSDTFTEREWARMKKTNYYDLYRDITNWPVEPGTTFLDVDWGSQRASPKFRGFWRVKSQDRWRTAPSQTRIIPCDRLWSLDGLQFPAPERRRFISVLKRHLVDHKLWDTDTEENHYIHLEIGLYEFWREYCDELVRG